LTSCHHNEPGWRAHRSRGHHVSPAAPSAGCAERLRPPQHDAAQMAPADFSESAAGGAPRCAAAIAGHAGASRSSKRVTPGAFGFLILSHVCCGQSDTSGSGLSTIPSSPSVGEGLRTIAIEVLDVVDSRFRAAQEAAAAHLCARAADSVANPRRRARADRTPSRGRRRRVSFSSY
jgi:hypothetical protein